MSKEQDQVFFRNFSLVVGVLAVMMVVFIIVARIVGIDEEADLEQRANAVSERTAPMGVISVEGEMEETKENMAMEAGEVMDPGMDMATTETEMTTSDSEAPANDGKSIYDGVCFACHGSGIPGIPQFGDATAWAPRIEQGNDTLYKHAIEGFTGSSGMMMPPKGANPDLSDDAVKAAVDYIVTNSQ